MKEKEREEGLEVIHGGLKLSSGDSCDDHGN